MSPVEVWVPTIGKSAIPLFSEVSCSLFLGKEYGRNLHKINDKYDVLLYWMSPPPKGSTEAHLYIFFDIHSTSISDPLG